MDKNEMRHRKSKFKLNTQQAEDYDWSKGMRWSEFWEEVNAIVNPQISVIQDFIEVCLECGTGDGREYFKDKVWDRLGDISMMISTVKTDLDNLYDTVHYHEMLAEEERAAGGAQ